MQKVNEKDLKYRGGDSGVKYLFRGPNLDWGVLLLKPGETMGEHGHNQVEETFYFIEGSARIMVAGKFYQAQAGEAFRVEPKERHDIINDSRADVKVAFIKYPYLPEDKI
jgi:mannose-6-phosphate isomerase-like protein (cupin superfamily)